MFSEWYESFPLREWILVNPFYIIGAVILALFLFRYFRPQIKGFRGEQSVRRRLRSLNKNEYKVIVGESGPKSFFMQKLSFIIL